MLPKRLTLLASAIAASAAIATPAHALFGVTCIPTLYNCSCTYMVPCPVKDSSAIAKLVVENTQMNEKLNLLKDIKQPGAMLLKAMNGEEPYGIPGLGSIGLDLNGIMNGNLSSLGVPSLGGDLVSQLSNLGIDGNMLSSIASGSLDVNDFLQVAQNAGLDMSVLEDVGLGLDQITALASGNLDINGVLDVAQSLGLEAGVLDDIGITEDLLVSIANGNIDAGRILEIAETAGLDMSALESVGLDLNTISNLPNAGPDFVAQVLQNSGYDSSITTALGLDASMIAQISSGQLPPSAINQLVEGTGIDPSSITLPGVNGPIQVGDDPLSNLVNAAGSGMGGAAITTANSSTIIPGADGLSRSTNSYDVITIPNSSVPGLQNALDSALGTTSNSGVFTSADEAAIAAMCAADMSLISVDEVPNGFGDDVENIHLAISGGTIETFEEAKEAAISVGASTSAFGYGRSIQVRGLLVKAIEAVDTFDQMIQDAETYEDDIIVNDTIKAQLMTAQAETASVLTALASTHAATLMKPRYLNATPLFPETARFRDMIVDANETRAQQIAQQSSQSASDYGTNMSDFQELYDRAQEAIHNHNLQTSANSIESGVSGLEFVIDNHEGYKSALYYLEERIRSALLVLYGSDDAESAWDILRPQLASAAAQYSWPDNDKWSAGYAVASSLSPAIVAQTETTAYGSRVLLQPATREDPPIYTSISETAYSYPAVDSHASDNNDPYDIQRVTSRSDDEQSASGTELVGLLQYYLETFRREMWTGALRRGEGERIMTGSFWNEMIYHAPECLSGPIPMSESAIQDRPELFDLDKNCDHLVWSYGDDEDYIDASNLGGADAALWVSKINLDRVEKITGGETATQEAIVSALSNISSSTAGSLLTMAGNPEAAEQLVQIMERLQEAEADTGFQSSIQLQ